MTTLDKSSEEASFPIQRLSPIADDIVKTPQLSERSKLTKILKLIPLLTGLGNNIMGTGSGIAQLIALGKYASDVLRSMSHTVAHVSQYGGIALALLDFIRVPSIYLSSWITGEKSSVTLAKNARWLHATLLLGLAITALAVPAAAAPIALATGVLGVGVSVVALSWTLIRRHGIKRQLKTIDAAINDKDAKLTAINVQLNEAKKNNEVEIELNHRHEQIIQEINELYTKKAKFTKKLNKRDLPAITDKTVGVTLSTLALAGLVVYLFFPPVGIALMTASAGMGTLYIAARVTVPLMKNLAGWIGEKLKKDEAQQDKISDGPDKVNEMERANAQDVNSQGSTATMLNQLPNTQNAKTTAYEPTPVKVNANSSASTKNANEPNRKTYSFFSSFPFKLLAQTGELTSRSMHINK